jgi:PAS domain S-box-containing protein
LASTPVPQAAAEVTPASPAEPGASPADAARLRAAALHAERLRLYARGVGSAFGAQLVALPLIVAALWEQVPRQPLLVWLALCIVLLLLRWALVWPVRDALRRVAATPRAGTLAAAQGVPLWRLAVGVALSGLGWGLAALMLWPPPGSVAQVFLVFVCAGMAAGSLVLTAFDVRASLSFALLALLPVAAQLLLQGDAAGYSMALMVAVFIGFLALTGWRAQRNLLETVAARVDDALRQRELLAQQQRREQLAEALARQTSALQITLDSMDQGILSLGPDGRLQFYNQRLVALTGLPTTLLDTRPTMAEIAGWQAAQGEFGPELAHFDPISRDIMSRWQRGEAVQFPPRYLRRTPDGRMLEVHSRYLDDGSLVRTFSDVSAFFETQQRLQASQAQADKLALVAAHTADAVVITDAGFHIEWVNDAFTAMTGWTLAEAQGRYPVELLHPEGLDIEAVARVDEQIHRSGQGSGELMQRARDGRLYWCALQVQAVHDEAGQLRHYISVSRDITQRRADETALRAARDEAERASRAKSDFLSSMSHELRTPMNAILGFAQLLELDPAAPLTPRQREQVQHILRAGAHLLALINDVLDLARVEAGKQPMLIEAVPVGPLLRECVALVRPLAAARGIALDIDVRDDTATGTDASIDAGAGPSVRADRLRLRQVLLNLLSNAIKYNHAEGRVRCAVASVRHGDGPPEVLLSVSDTGPGLDAAERERLFQPFERLGAEGGMVEGAGIGLALSRQLMALMDGRIEVDSRTGEGSTFRLVLPAGAAEVTPPAATVHAARVGQVAHQGSAAAVDLPLAAAPPASAPALRVRRVLYIEDNPVNLMLMEATLEGERGVQLATAPLPALGLELAFNDPPDLVLLDIQLPGMDGFEVLRRLRADPRTAAVPVVAVSANAMPDDLARARQAGFDDYLTKPLDLARLRAVVQQPWRGAPVTDG